MDSSDSDDRPLGERFGTAQLKGDAGKRSNSGSPLPDWLSENNSPVKALELLSDSDEVLEVASSDDGAEEGAGPGPGSAAEQKEAPRKRGRAAAPQAKRNLNRVLLSSEDNDSDDGEGSGKGQQPVRKRQKTMVATQQSQRLSSQDSAGPSQKAPSRKAAGSGGKAALRRIQEEDEQPDNDVGGEGTQAIVGSQAAKGPKSPVSKTAVLAPVAGEIPVMMPEKLPVTKFIVELEGGNDSSVDLTGDAGVVGRWLVEGDDSNPELKMDLKGVVYAATTVPCATTLCVVNLSATEARVEALAHQYIQLRPLGALGSPGDDNADDNYFMYDDDDNYQYEGASQHPGAADDAGPSGKGPKKKPKAAAGKAKKAPAKRAGAAGKPAKKKPAKAAAGGKAKAKK